MMNPMEIMSEGVDSILPRLFPLEIHHSRGRTRAWTRPGRP